MTVNKLNRKLILEAPQSLPDGAGGYRQIWQQLGTIWADVSPLSGQEVQEGTAPRNQVKHRIVVRAAPPGSDRRPEVRQRFREGDRVYRIQSVTVHDRKSRYLRCMVEEEQMI